MSGNNFNQFIIEDDGRFIILANLKTKTIYQIFSCISESKLNLPFTMKKLLLLPLFSMLYFISQAQDQWDLKKCVEYAVSNNISVKQADVQARLTELNLKQFQLSQIPTLFFGGNLGYSSGRSPRSGCNFCTYYNRIVVEPIFSPNQRNAFQF